MVGLGELVEPVHQVVTGDHADPRRQAEAVGHLPHGLRAPGRVEAAGVGHDLDAAIDAAAHHLLHLGHERAGEATARTFGPGAGQDQHRQLGQPVTGQEVDGPAVDHLGGRGHAVAVEA